MGESSKSKRKPKNKMEPITYEELVGSAGMSGYVSFLEVKAPEQTHPGGTEGAGGTGSATKTARESLTVRKEAKRKTQSPGEEDTGSESHTVLTEIQRRGAEATERAQGGVLRTVSGMVTVRDKRIRRAVTVRDGHSLGEQALYQALWEEAAPEGDGGRVICMGYDRMAKIANLHWTNVRKNLQALEKKLAIETVEREDSGLQKGKTYRVFSAEDVVRRREAAGMVWVRRTRGVEFVLVS
jgi:hypothetical protein